MAFRVLDLSKSAVLLYEYMDQYCKLNGIPLSALFIYLNLVSILA